MTCGADEAYRSAAIVRLQEFQRQRGEIAVAFAEENPTDPRAGQLLVGVVRDGNGLSNERWIAVMQDFVDKHPQMPGVQSVEAKLGTARRVGRPGWWWPGQCFGFGVRGWPPPPASGGTVGRGAGDSTSAAIRPMGWACEPSPSASRGPS